MSGNPKHGIKPLAEKVRRKTLDWGDADAKCELWKVLWRASTAEAYSKEIVVGKPAAERLAGEQRKSFADVILSRL